jgi:hypothetical protein
MLLTSVVATYPKLSSRTAACTWGTRQRAPSSRARHRDGVNDAPSMLMRRRERRRKLFCPDVCRDGEGTACRISFSLPGTLTRYSNVLVSWWRIAHCVGRSGMRCSVFADLCSAFSCLSCCLRVTRTAGVPTFVAPQRAVELRVDPDFSTSGTAVLMTSDSRSIVYTNLRRTVGFGSVRIIEHDTPEDIHWEYWMD